jgi:uncharacterized protein YgbK (DUF1537 family)
MYLGVIADDFTGASDIANTLAKGGLATTQFFGLPANNISSACDAGVTRSATRFRRARVQATRPHGKRAEVDGTVSLS